MCVCVYIMRIYAYQFNDCIRYAVPSLKADVVVVVDGDGAVAV
jgi:hypothetical protein